MGCSPNMALEIIGEDADGDALENEPRSEERRVGKECVNMC